MNSNNNDLGRLIVVVGGQFGSEAKGHLAAQLSMGMRPGSLVVRTGGPNAGHTVWQGDREYKLRHLPTPIAMRDDLHMALAARSVVDPTVLLEELDWFPRRTVIVDPAATILEEQDKADEAYDPQMTAIGSTRKGIGAARARRINRTARTAWDLWGQGGAEANGRIVTATVADWAETAVADGHDVMIEAAQGFGLGLHGPFYPYATSADCTAIDALADCRLSPWSLGVEPEVWMAIRPYPIRVAGTSGPLADETSWGELGLPEERTTVTNKVRRVGHFDPGLVRQAAQANGQPKIALMMMDQVVPACRGMRKAGELDGLDSTDQGRIVAWVSMVEDVTDCEVGAIGTGPATMIFRDEF